MNKLFLAVVDKVFFQHKLQEKYLGKPMLTSIDTRWKPRAVETIGEFLREDVGGKFNSTSLWSQF